MTEESGDNAEYEVMVARLRKIRDSWAMIRDKNREIGWPEMADVVSFPDRFVYNINLAMCECCIRGEYVPAIGRACKECRHGKHVHETDHEGLTKNGS